MAALQCQAEEPGDDAPRDALTGNAARVCGRLHVRQNARAALKRITGSGARQRTRNEKLYGESLEGCFAVERCRTRGWLLSYTRLFFADVDFFSGKLEEQAHRCFIADPTLRLRNRQG